MSIGTHELGAFEIGTAPSPLVTTASPPPPAPAPEPERNYVFRPMTAQLITPLPTPPSRLDPVNFSARTDAFLLAMQRAAEEFNLATPGDSAAGLAQYLGQTGSGKGAGLVAFLQAAAGAVKRTVEEKLYDVKCVSDFEAAGDWNGTTGTDDTAALQAAFNWLGSGARRCLTFAHGARHRTTDTLTMLTTWTARQCKVDFNNAEIVYAGTSIALDLSASGISCFSNLNLTAGTAGQGVGIYARPGVGQYAGQSIFSSINIQGFSKGVHWGSANGGASGGWTTNWIDLDVSGCITGVHLSDGGNNALVFVGPRIASNGTGVLIDGSCYGVTFLGGAIEFNTSAAIRFGGTGEKFALTFDGVYLENANLDFDVLAGATNLRNWTVRNCYIMSTSASKLGVCAVGAGSAASNVAFRDNFIYHPGGAPYGQLPDGTVLDNNFAPFEAGVSGSNLIFAQGETIAFPNGDAGVVVAVTTRYTTVKTQRLAWTFYHDNNDGGYVFTGEVIVTGTGAPISTTIIAKKSDGTTAATGTVAWSNSGGFLRFTYTPPGGLSTVGTTTLKLRAL